MELQRRGTHTWTSPNLIWVEGPLAVFLMGSAKSQWCSFCFHRKCFFSDPLWTQQLQNSRKIQYFFTSQILFENYGTMHDAQKSISLLSNRRLGYKHVVLTVFVLKIFSERTRTNLDDNLCTLMTAWTTVLWETLLDISRRGREFHWRGLYEWCCQLFSGKYKRCQVCMLAAEQEAVQRHCGCDVSTLSHHLVRRTVWRTWPPCRTWAPTPNHGTYIRQPPCSVKPLCDSITGCRTKIFCALHHFPSLPRGLYVVVRWSMTLHEMWALWVSAILVRSGEKHAVGGGWFHSGQVAVQLRTARKALWLKISTWILVS